MKKALKIIGIIVMVIIVLLTGASMLLGAYTAKEFLHFNSGNDTKENSKKQLEVWEFDIDSFEAEWKSEQIVLESSDKTEIFVQNYVPKEKTRGYAIVVHGAGGDYLSVAPITRMYLENNYTVLAFDQRASGDSKATEGTFGFREKFDVQAIVDYLDTQLNTLPIILHGQSMGAATAALYGATDHATTHLDALILDSPFDSMERMVVSVMTENLELGEDEANYSAFFANIHLSLFEGFSFKDTDVIANAPKIQVPTLFIQSTLDDITPPAIGKTIFEAIGTTNKRYLELDSKHIEGIIDFKDDYEKTVLAFIN